MTLGSTAAVTHSTNQIGAQKLVTGIHSLPLFVAGPVLLVFLAMFLHFCGWLCVESEEERAAKRGGLQ